MEIASRGIHKGKDKEQSHEKRKENFGRLLEEKSVEEILKVVQVGTSQIVIQNNHNVHFHGQKSNLEQLVPKGLRAQGETNTQQLETISCIYLYGTNL